MLLQLNKTMKTDIFINNRNWKNNRNIHSVTLIYVVNVVQHFLLSRLSYCLLNLSNKDGITLIPAYIPTYINVEAYYLLWGRLVPEWHLLSCIVQTAFQPCQLEVALLASLGKSPTFGSLGVEHFQPSLDISGELCVSFSLHYFP